MERRIPWQWTEARGEQLVAAVCILCAAFAAPAFVSTMLDSDMYNPSRNGLPLVISTAVWAWTFRRALWKRNLWHALWVGPVFGALNAGTTLGLSALVAGQGAGETVGGVLVGSMFGTFIGGGPLGIAFGGVLAVYIKYTRTQIAKRGPAASLDVLRASACIFALAATCSVMLQPPPSSQSLWPTHVLLFVGAATAFAATLAHLHAMWWARIVRSGAQDGARVRRDESDAEVVVLAVRGNEEGAFRTPESERVLGHLPQYLGFGVTQCVAAMAAIVGASVSVVLNS